MLITTYEMLLNINFNFAQLIFLFVLLILTADIKHTNYKPITHSNNHTKSKQF